jgi:hypothetical protein
MLWDGSSAENELCLIPFSSFYYFDIASKNDVQRYFSLKLLAIEICHGHRWIYRCILDSQ